MYRLSYPNLLGRQRQGKKTVLAAHSMGSTVSLINAFQCQITKLLRMPSGRIGKSFPSYSACHACLTIPVIRQYLCVLYSNYPQPINNSFSA